MIPNMQISNQALWQNPYMATQMYQQQLAQMQSQMPQTQQNQQSTQSKMVEAIPVDTVSEAENCPMAAGTSAFFFAKDDSFNAVKSVAINGQVTFEVYDRRPPTPPTPAPVYMTRPEVEELIASAMSAKKEAAE